MIDLRLLLLCIIFQKTCTVCGAMKDLTEFYPNRQGRFGRAAQCIKCDSRRKRNSYQTRKLVLKPIVMEM